jgi:hypothetical protein
MDPENETLKTCMSAEGSSVFRSTIQFPSETSVSLKQRIQTLEEELENTKRELSETKEHLKRYTAPVCKKAYYENNKEEINRKKREYQPTEEQKRRWARTAYLKSKEKKKSSGENI